MLIKPQLKTGRHYAQSHAFCVVILGMCTVQAKLAEYKLKADLDLIEGSMTVLTTRLELFCV